MNHLLEDDPELMPRREREVTLSTGSILGIFFGLVLLCGFFFALGYNLHKPAQPAAAATDTTDAAASGKFDHFNKPSAGLPVNAPAATPTPQPVATSGPVSTAPVPAATPLSETPASAPDTTPAAVPHTAPIALHPAAPAPAQPESALPAATGSFVVQVAAVSHQEDADLLVGALRAKGYAVAAHTQPQDKLLHIQVGPFSNRKDADAMRQRLLADGYNAIVK